MARCTQAFNGTEFAPKTQQNRFKSNVTTVNVNVTTALTDGVSVSHYSTGETQRTTYSVGTTRHYNFGPGEFMLHDLTNVREADLAFITV